MKQSIYRSCFYPPAWEQITAYWWDNHLVGLSLGEAAPEAQERKLLRCCAAANIVECPPKEKTQQMVLLEREITEYLAGERTLFTVPIALYGTEYQKKIWTALLQLPYGSTASYADLAAHAGVRGHRATGSAVGANPIAILVPCHRILPRSGGLGNYSTGKGPETKQALLKLESDHNQGRNRLWK
ncbi:MAG: methylated-DNA--[protein]-cysteine S-methyltransferase [Angelakisella sp.]